MNASPEGRTLTRYAVTAVLGIIALIIGTRAYVGVVFGWIVVGAGALGTRVVYAAPLRFAHRNATLRLTVVWYLFLAEIIAGATAFAPVFDRRGSPAVAIAALVVAFVLEGTATALQRTEYVRLNVIVPPIATAGPDEIVAFSGEALGPANEAFKSALGDVLPRIATVVRAYLVNGTGEGGTARRVLALRFAFPWVDVDAVAASRIVYGRMFPPARRSR